MDSFHYEHAWREGPAARYTNLLRRFGKVIKLQVFGHWHTDEFRVVTTADVGSGGADSSEDDGEGWEDDDAATSEKLGRGDTWWISESSPMLIAGSVSPVYDANPSFRIITFDDATFELLDWEVWYASLSLTNEKTAMSDLTWSPLYSLRDTYGMSSANNSEFLSLAYRMLTDDDLFNTFLLNFRAQCFDDNEKAVIGDCYGSKHCGTTCRRGHVCTLMHGQRADAFERCRACDVATWGYDALLHPGGCGDKGIGWFSQIYRSWILNISLGTGFVLAAASGLCFLMGYLRFLDRRKRLGKLAHGFDTEKTSRSLDFDAAGHFSSEGREAEPLLGRSKSKEGNSGEVKRLPRNEEPSTDAGLGDDFVMI